jgi:hypothetical protein
MWYPTRDELIANHVITRVSLGGETASGFNVGSVEELRTAFTAVPLWTAVDGRFPGTVDRAVQLAWDAKQRGMPNEQVMSAARSVLSELVPKALSTARDEQLEAFLSLTRTELTESLAVSAQACSKLLAGQLNVTATLPKAIVEQEMAFMQDLFGTPPRTDTTPLSRQAAGQAMAAALNRLTPKQVETVSAIERYSAQPELQCKTLIAFYDEVARLAPAPRRLALRAMYQMGR